ncbi:hypothetical protein OG481_01945 [Streptomyces longwoodensis]|uniref:hypothetical protein n=1 Tax=Streptomyces longwoodensis TaxID=68231 RepID=UPI002DD84F12|nr:hypothetical protein [Streptomyces longwoodensis]WRY87354.1 hypothetical protein OG481_01945 [Streptomyces longwoodensis]
MNYHRCDVPRDDHEGEIRPYVNGPKCDRHSPWAVKGLPKPQPGPGLPAGAWTTPSPLSDSALFDDRAVASGKRRASPEAYRAAQAATNHTTT